MKINVRVAHGHVPETVREYATQKVTRLERFFDHIQSLSVDLEVVDHSDESTCQHASILCRVPGTVLRADDVQADMKAAIDLVVDKMERQLKKHKGKVRDHIRDDKSERYRVLPRSDAKTKSAALDPDMLYRPKPMGPEDAAKIIEEERLPFLMFRNFTTDKINVLYPMGDDDYGLIEP